MKIAFLTSKESWLYKNKQKLLSHFNYDMIRIFSDPKKVSKSFDYTFVLSYYKKINEKAFKNKSFFVIHESNLPENRGFSPLYWQILKGKSKITYSIFLIDKKIDSGEIVYKKSFFFPKNILYEEIKNLQLNNAIKIIKEFLKKGKKKYKINKIKNTYLKKRTPKDSKIQINKSLKSQIDLLRICSNEKFPAYFFYKKKIFILKIFNITK
tara:strand:- start:550 stop:1179 length:630 start_codon:yes stop_codon:yes gene_type:complete